MKKPILKLAASALLLLIVAGCSSSGDKERQIEAIASHRATILSNSLPIEHGPLTIMQAKANGHIVELMMLYNDDGTISPQQLMDNSVRYYCTNTDVEGNLQHGVVYNLKMRSPRGQLLIDQVVSLETCELLNKKNVENK
ncbi:GspS/AspS pilotin family protein [Vibrio sp. TH_r3]|uniref:GspS/AspS pilotin family protein n=1 Tax=Vibrio sp. TH_r3 TaxID=3082084 RepID=UPI002953F347|nr:GspS/AspS pilotin family protein [Vibrio sp. TH_r3]MDV7102956.1 GspS/AspS pilotin family protein [Vibrio sp. TH_r3]